jgi:hypothetical protein
VHAAAACVTVKVWPAIVAAPVRLVVAVFAAAVTVTVPSPLPLAGLTVIQAAELVAVQPHPVAAVTVTEEVSPAAAGEIAIGEIAKLQGAAACVTVTVWPAIVTVPARAVVAVFAATATATVPLPLPLAGLTVIQAAELAAVQAHPPGAVTVTDEVLPAAAGETAVGEIAKLHAGAAACVTVRVWPAIVAVPVRLVVAVLATTVTATVPFPPPLAGLTVIQLAPLAAVQLHPAAAVTPTDEVPPAAAGETVVGEIP